MGFEALGVGKWVQSLLDEPGTPLAVYACRLLFKRCGIRGFAYWLLLVSCGGSKRTRPARHTDKPGRRGGRSTVSRPMAMLRRCA